MRRLGCSLLAVLVLALGACAPVAETVVDLIERSDGATLHLVNLGLAFDPGAEMARGETVRAEGDELHLLEAPDGTECTVTTRALDCRLGNITEPTKVSLPGRDVIANATWRRASASTVNLTFARVPNPDPGGEGE